MIRIGHLDHLVLTVTSIETSCKFYGQVLGFVREEFGAGRVALKFAKQKINLHQAGSEFEPKSKNPTPGSADLCFISNSRMDEILLHLEACDVVVEEGPVIRTGANNKINSVYIRDPDGNLIEISVALSA